MHSWRLALLALLGISVGACAARDPALRQAIADVERRPDVARVQLRPFAEQGHPAAIAQICIAYGRSMDYRVREGERAQAFDWCRQAAAAGNTEAQYHLGMFYKSGIGTAEDRVAALHWYQESASHGHEEARNEARGLQGLPRICKNLITGCRMF